MGDSLKKGGNLLNGKLCIVSIPDNLIMYKEYRLYRR